MLYYYLLISYYQSKASKTKYYVLRGFIVQNNFIVSLIKKLTWKQ